MKAVYIVKGLRTPCVKAGTQFKDIPAPFLATNLVRNLLDRAGIKNDEVDEVIFGNTGTPAKYPNIARVIALEAGLDLKTDSYSVHRNCASGLEALSQAYLKIASGRSQIVVAGGTENMSQMPLMFGEKLKEIFLGLAFSKTLGQRIQHILKLRLQHLKPVIALEQGLTDPFCNINMGMTAELLARRFGITRTEQDTVALTSHQRAVAATKAGFFKDEILPMPMGKKLEKLCAEDIGPRDNSSLEKLGKMKPYFDRKTGTVTVANACPITDGAAACLLVSEDVVEKYGLKPMAKIIDYHFHGNSPEQMGIAPLFAMEGVLARAGMKLSDMDLIELNEAFAAQVLACQKIAKNETLAKEIGLKGALGEIRDDILNVNGSGIALGHPVGATGTRIVVSLMHELKRRGKKYGMATLCIGGGQGGAMIIENLS